MIFIQMESAPLAHLPTSGSVDPGFDNLRDRKFSYENTGCPESNSIRTTEILRHKNAIDQQNSKQIQQKLDASVAEEQNKNWEENIKQLEKIIYGHNSHTTKIDKNSKQKGVEIYLLV